MALGRFGVGSFGDDQPIEFWMDDQSDQTAQRDAFAAAGSERWNAATRSGETLMQAAPRTSWRWEADRGPAAPPPGKTRQGGRPRAAAEPLTWEMLQPLPKADPRSGM